MSGGGSQETLGNIIQSQKRNRSGGTGSGDATPALKMLNRLVASVVSRLGKRELVKTALWHLEDVAYERLKENGFSPGGIIDIGAYKGNWARSIREVFPAPILMIEAREAQREILARVCSEQPNTEFHIALLGSERREGVSFTDMGTASSIYAERSDMPRRAVELKMTTLDALATKLTDPLFLKLDVQGAELDVLRGGLNTLDRAEIVQLELPFLAYNEGAPDAREVIDFMDDQGFAPYDVVGFVRPHDKSLVQVDMLFARKTSNLRPQFFAFKT